ncbi:MAG: DUF4382 domain-containing protein [Gemmatimonadota bacterium]|nr:DUF4382 domain-containing protein [Gemmatimonadota bacterium]
MSSHLLRLSAAALLTGAAWACSSSGSSALSPQSGTLEMQLTDAPFPSDSVQSVNVFVVRIDARQETADSASADSATSGDSASAGGWKTVATPDTVVDLLSYQNGATLPLGAATLSTGQYDGFRMIIDPTKSNVVLANGMVLSGSSSPGIMFPSGSRSGIKIDLSSPVAIAANDTTSVLFDFNVGNSFVLRGNSITQNGLLFKPVIQGSIH